MKIDNKGKNDYITPLIVCVELDNEISLALESMPPSGPGEPTGYAPEYFNKDPLKSNQV